MQENNRKARRDWDLQQELKQGASSLNVQLQERTGILPSALKHDLVYLTGTDTAPLVALVVPRAAAGTGVGVSASHQGRGGAQSGIHSRDRLSEGSPKPAPPHGVWLDPQSVGLRAGAPGTPSPSRTSAPGLMLQGVINA
ncbi:unnamed protein product [Rangifer tarandus platyrhynchus]|uniref:Uncharacterized protein n=1 Tax=Rangifer tarandus platyrhynchus TaxID=3082113 RepID=A0AC59ZMK7_RANTA